jgi:hypothetical protein
VELDLDSARLARSPDRVGTVLDQLLNLPSRVPAISEVVLVGDVLGHEGRRLTVCIEKLLPIGRND